MSEPEVFHIKSGNENFNFKQKDLFNILATIEKDVNLPANPEEMQVDEDALRHRARKSRKHTKALRGRESLFKAPELPLWTSRIPDHRRNPNRWTKYTLADVAQSDMSEASNTAAAMDFLRSVRGKETCVHKEPPVRVEFCSKQKRNQRVRLEESESLDISQEITAPSKPVIGFGDICLPIEETTPTEKPVFKQGKLVMPEYVIGEKIKKPKRSVQKVKQVGKELHLSHLMEQDDD